MILGCYNCFPTQTTVGWVIEFDEAVPTEDVTMRQLLARRALRSGISLVGLAVLVVGCASHSLVPKGQAGLIRDRDRALTPHAAAIEDVIRRSGTLGALAFLDAGDGHLVVLPGDTPTDAWARHTAAGPGTAGGPVSVPTVVDFVHRPDVPKAPETVTHAFLQQQETLRARMTALDTELRKLSDSLAATRKETQASIATARERHPEGAGRPRGGPGRGAEVHAADRPAGMAGSRSDRRERERPAEAGHHQPGADRDVGQADRDDPAPLGHARAPAQGAVDPARRDTNRMTDVK